ncbi:metalloregulator ArsR/SmtB family transcription factor [Geopsychrobacter electrodiphilus]|uniref:metalloregulator ArsR/SmtB family transcription factor n=1 Tax=Geopsychrobacter electrodiphilus TaxID=225196 RepID=UPI0003710C32|nr:metalloregulator ArsR/SmtB family transcription factor [Geopsychrobacter electrodiphilus]
MKFEESITIMKALADPSRLAIINSLLERSQYVEELATRHALAASTISFHLRKLEKAKLVSSQKEQYYVVFSANKEIFDTTLREIVAAHPLSRELQDSRMNVYQAKVLKTFFHNGRLEKLPAQHKKRLIVLEQFVARFALDSRYNEQQVTELILPLFDDYCLIRRLLVDEGLIRREGATYWRELSTNPTTAIPVLPVPNRKESEQMEKSARSAIKRTYKQDAPDMGVFQIRNLANGKIYIASSRNLEGERNSRLFQLRMGSVPFSRELQEDLDELGKDAFEFSVLAVLDKPAPDEDAEQSLAALELHWLETLQPFGEHGYNSEKTYQKRTRENH